MAWKKAILIKGIVLLAFSLCSLTNSLAEVEWQKFQYFQNWGGINDQLSVTEIEDNEASDLENVVSDTGGMLKKRFGFLTIPNNPVTKASTGSSVSLTGLAFYAKNNGDKFVVAITNNDGKATAMSRNSNNLTTAAWVNIDFNALPSGYTNNNFPDFAVAEDKLVITVPAPTQSKPFQWTGSGNVGYLTSDPDVPNATIVEYHKNHLFLAGDNNNPSRITFSELDDIANYTATDFFDVQTADGTRVRGLISAFDSLYIFKDNSIWRLSGRERDNFILEQMVQGVGTLSNQSVKVVNNLIYFTTSQNNIAVYDGGYAVKFISSKIRNTIGGLNFSRATNTIGLAFSSYRYQDQDYYCSVSSVGTTTNNRILLYDTYFKSWLKFTGINANAWCVGEDSNGRNILLFGDYDGYVHSYPSTTFYDGNVETNPIAAFYQTKWFKYSESALGDKYWRLLKTYALSETTSDTFLYAECKNDYVASGKTVSINLSESGALWDVALWDVGLWSGSGLIVGRNEVELGRNMFQIKFYNNNINEGFTLIGFENFIERTSRI